MGIDRHGRDISPRGRTGRRLRRVVAVLDWKSDAKPDAERHAQHVGQLRDYMRLAGAGRGVLVYMTPGRVEWIDSSTAG